MGGRSSASAVSASTGGRVGAERVTRRLEISVSGISSVVSVVESRFTDDFRGFRGFVATRRLLRFVGVSWSAEAGFMVDGGFVGCVDSDGARVDFLRLFGGGDSTELKISSSCSSSSSLSSSMVD